MAGVHRRTTSRPETLVAVNELPFGQVGGGSTVTVIVELLFPVLALSSVTVSVTVKVPPAV